MHNGKLAGRSTYQDLMEFAFGRPGLVAISIFQFAFAFGGMFEHYKIINNGADFDYRNVCLLCHHW